MVRRRRSGPISGDPPGARSVGPDIEKTFESGSCSPTLTVPDSPTTVTARVLRPMEIHAALPSFQGKFIDEGPDTGPRRDLAHRDNNGRGGEARCRGSSRASMLPTASALNLRRAGTASGIAALSLGLARRFTFCHARYQKRSFVDSRETFHFGGKRVSGPFTRCQSATAWRVKPSEVACRWC